MNAILDKLNDKQREAVTAPLGPVLILAGAGSGKTRALTHRIAWLIAEKKIAPENILALTFTNKAAGEMRERINKLVSVPRSPAYDLRSTITAGTFHSVCARLLREEIVHLPLPSPPIIGGETGGYSRSFTIFDSDDSLHLLKQIVLEKGLADRFRPQVFAWYISQAKNRLVAPGSLAIDNDFLREALEEVYDDYTRQLREQNALDFDDLLGLVCRLWQSRPEILEKYRERFRYVLVDEYQDTNHVQYVLLKMLVKKHRNLFVVGDDAQSIYGFRGANMQNILDFKKDYPKAKVILLEQNYRSSGSILGAANQVIGLNPFQYEKKLWTNNGEGAKVNLYEAQDENEEAEFVLKRILSNSIVIASDSEAIPEEDEIASSSTPRNDRPAGILDRFVAAQKRWRRPRIIASEIPDDLQNTVILYRTHAQSRPFEEALLSAGLPYQIVGGFKFYERREIKDAMAYLRLLNNPRDLVSLQRVINIPPRGIGPAGLKKVVVELKGQEYDFDKMTMAGDFFETLSAAAALPQKKNLMEAMELLLVRSGYKEQLLADREEGLERWENIEELFNAAAKYRRLPWNEGVGKFLEEVALMTDLDRADGDSNRLTLMTLHSAKGLEFERVFLVGLEEGILPHSRSLAQPQELAEEVRLAYVGITRARKDLFLSYARQRAVYGELRRTMPSRILKAIPGKLLNKISNL